MTSRSERHRNPQPATPRRDAAEIKQGITQTFEIVRMGLRDFTGPQAERRIGGLRNVVVYGVATTQAVQNLRGLDKTRFDAWYAPWRAEMEGDELLRFFWKMRSRIVKEGTTAPATWRMSFPSGFDSSDWNKDPPPGATKFFMFDEAGGVGWIVTLPDGTESKYYVSMPEGVIDYELAFENPPSTHLAEPLADTTAAALAELYVAYLSRLVGAAQQYFAVPE
jgi:hypothetical protein